MSVKHTIVSIIPCWFSVLDSIVFLYWYMIDPPCLACVFLFVNLYQIWGVISPVRFHKYLSANLNLPSLQYRPPKEAQTTQLSPGPDRNWLVNLYHE